MTARLQAASPQSLTLLRVTSSRGHGHGSSLKDDIALNTDILAFLFDRLGMQYKANQ
jgi:prolyl oligopeptidase PreP (S9A serine peptidase family)